MLGIDGIGQDVPLRTALAGVDRGSSRLWLDGTAKDFAALAEFTALASLDIYRLPARQVPVLAGCRLPRLASLGVRQAAAADLAFAAGFATLDSLTVWQSPKVARLDGVERLTGLRRLVLSDLGGVESLAPLAALTELRELVLTGGIWSTQGLPSLEPLRALGRLEHLNLTAAKVADGNLDPIAALPRLSRLELSPRNFAPEAIAGVAAAHPFFFQDLLALPDFDDWAGAPGCRKCKGRRKVMFLRRKKLLWCPTCEGAKLDMLIAGFTEMVAARRPTAP